MLYQTFNLKKKLLSSCLFLLCLCSMLQAQPCTNVIHPVTGVALGNSSCINTVQMNATFCCDVGWDTECQRLYEYCAGTYSISPFIHIDQFGYRSFDTKVAVISNPQVGYNAFLSYTPAIQLQVRNAATNALVYTSNLWQWNNGDTHAQSGDQGWWFDFSEVTTSGTYYIYDAVNDERSADFEIGETVYGEVMRQTGRMFYYNRSNIAKEMPYAEAAWTDTETFMHPNQHANCRYFYDQNNAALEKDLTGGWYDAGDQNKYVTFTNGTLHNLMWAYIEYPESFSDNWNIPASNNGIPDLIDEIKWELDWLMKMNNTDGSTHLKMGSVSHDVNDQAPLSLNMEPVYYIGTCTSASIAVASTFAQAAKLFATFPALTAYAQELESRAVASWNYVLPFLNANQLETDCDNLDVVSGDADWTVNRQRSIALIAAIHLFDLTGENSYHQYIINNIADAENPDENSWSPYTVQVNDARLLYAAMPNANAATRNIILNSFDSYILADWNDIFGITTADLYRSHTPDWSHHFGSNLVKSTFGIMNIQAAKSNLVPNSNDDFMAKARQHIHYIHGVNPQGIVYLSNMYEHGGDRCVDELFHIWFQDDSPWDNALSSQSGPPPGFLVGGPNVFYESYQGTLTPSPPANQPHQKSYWSFNDFEYPSPSITEPGIYYQAAYLRLLTAFTSRNYANCYEHEFSLILNSDAYPEDISWEVRNSENTLVASGQNYDTYTPGVGIIARACLPSDCYTFTINDTYNDGICCGSGNGTYTISARFNGAVVMTQTSTGDYGTSETLNFCLTETPCPPARTLSGVATSNTNLNAANEIISTQTINHMANITYEAGDCINLNPPFEVRHGGEFSADIINCNSTARDSSMLEKAGIIEKKRE